MDQALENIISCAKTGGEILREGFYKTKNIEFKGIVDLVTQYDKAVEEHVVKELSRMLPDLNIVAEEGNSVDVGGEYTAYIDPIDGTTNFVHGIPHTAVSIGVWDSENNPVIGVVYNPILDELFCALKGEGAFLNNRQLAVSRTNDLSKSLIATGFPYTKAEHGSDYHWVMDQLAKVLPITRDVRRLGSASIDLCYTAKGVFDAYYEMNLKTWDYAAGVLILQEAGGIVSNLENKNIGINEKVIVATNGAIHHKLLNILNVKPTKLY